MTPWHAKLLFAAVGAVCLSLLKLINANFYLGVTSREAVMYLTYVVYLALGMAVGYVFGEEHPTNAQKSRQSFFLMGLLAPSILLATINKASMPEFSLPAVEAGKIQTLGARFSDWLVPSVHAQPAGTRTAPASHRPVQVVKLGDFMPGFNDGVNAALGTQQVPGARFVWAAGKSTDVMKAEQTAQRLDALLLTQPSTKHLRTTIMQPAGSKEYFVTIGGIESAARSWQIDRTLKDAAAKAWTTGGDESAAKILVKGEVVKGESLFVK